MRHVQPTFVFQSETLTLCVMIRRMAIITLEELLLQNLHENVQKKTQEKK